MPASLPILFNEVQLAFKPLYEWAFGEKIAHPETTARAESILTALRKDPTRFDVREPMELSEKAILAVHQRGLVSVYKSARDLPAGVTFCPSVFPRGGKSRADPTNLQQAGYYCFDSGTPLSREVWQAALWSASSAVAAAKLVRTGESTGAYALSRPPGHHASGDAFGGYSYLNNAALAARELLPLGKVAILDIDFHHGNGTQAIFYRNPDVLFISIHGDPTHFYPYFSGFASETGSGPGRGANLNIPLDRGTDGQAYLRVMRRLVLPALKDFQPASLVLSAGLDAYEKDPVGGFGLRTDDFHRLGEVIGRIRKPTVIVQEGGYYTPHLGRNASALLLGFSEGAQPRKHAAGPAPVVSPEPLPMSPVETEKPIHEPDRVSDSRRPNVERSQLRTAGSGPRARRGSPRLGRRRQRLP
jgi:acetoin utilization deacetylase AcuC-like enzyme